MMLTAFTPRYTCTDLYKLTMKQAVWSNYPNAQVEYRFYNRDRGVDLLPYRDKIEEKIAELHGLGPTIGEIECLRALGFMKAAFLDELLQFKLNTNYVSLEERDGALEVFVRGPWYQTIDFEVPLLAIINEVYFEDKITDEVIAEGDRRISQKIELLKSIREEELGQEIAFLGMPLPTHPKRYPFELLEFGTRRALSRAWHAHVVERFAEESPSGMMIGTSNVWAACENGIKPQGTMAHEFIMAHQAFVPLHLSQRAAFDCWMHEYRGKLGIALSDTLGTKTFLRDFDLLLAESFAGARQDSGDPYEWGEAIIKHYESLGINPSNKFGVFTNSLTIAEAREIWRAFGGRLRTRFGIGTHLSNDVGLKPLNVVMKMVKCNGIPLIKISDDEGKITCEDPKLTEWAKHLLFEVL